MTPGPGWLPVQLLHSPRQGLFGDMAVRWMEFGNAAPEGPFFEDGRAKLAALGARQVDTDVETLLRVARGFRDARPAGMIFHVSHCGSTLVANALRTVPGSLVFSEDLTISQIFRCNPPDSPRSLCEYRDTLRRKMAEAVFRIYASYRNATETVVLKPASFASADLPVLRRWWPEIPCVFVIREPEDVIVSNMASGWGAGADFDTVREMNGVPEPMRGWMPEDVCGRVVGHLMRQGLRAAGPGCMVVDYEELKRRMPLIAAAFGMRLREDSPELARIYGTNAKDRGAGLAFTGDRGAKRERATVPVREAAQRFARAAYAELRAIS